MTTQLIPTNSDMQTFSPEQLKRAGELLGCRLDEASALKALIIQHDTGLSITRGEISIVPFAGKPTVMINKQGYLAYASRQADYDGYESGTAKEGDELTAWCTVFSKNRTNPTTVKIYESEFRKDNSPVWKEKPRYMLEKTAISLALRAAYPILNGTYTEEEISEAPRVSIEPREDDIVVQPQASPAPEPVKEEPAPAPTCQVYSLEQANTCLTTMANQGMDVSIFEKAKLPNGLFNKDMIDADYKRQMAEKKAAAKPAASPSFTGILSDTKCQICGNRILKDEEAQSVARFGIPLCERCFSAQLTSVLKSKQEKKE